MPVNATFGGFKKVGSVSVSNPRRVMHSLSNKWKGITTSGKMLEGVDKLTLAAGTTNAACTIACAAGVTGAFAVIASGPFAAGAIGVVGLILAAKNAYSNREAAHNALMPHVWSYIDDVPPLAITDSNKDDLGAASLSLISDGQPQQKLMELKFQEKEQEFNRFWTEYERLSYPHMMFREKNMKGELFIVGIWRNEDARLKCLQKAMEKGGAAYEFMRRLNHLGNYLQAATVFGKIIQKDKTPLDDLAASVASVNDVRKQLKMMSDRIESDNKAMDEVSKLLLQE
jgi:hypothetical protein